MSECFLAEIRIFACDYAPRNWAKCDGQLLPLAQHSALFGLVGTAYGGDGRTDFRIPDMRGRAPIHAGHAPGLTSQRWGQKSGAEWVTLSESQLPPHNHLVQAEPRDGVLYEPDERWIADGIFLNPSEKHKVTMGADSIGDTGGTGAHDNRQPYLALNFAIALEGTFPTRD